MNVRIVGCVLAFYDLFTADIVAMQLCYFQKDRGEQAICEFQCVFSMHARIVAYMLVYFALLELNIVEM